MRLGARNTNAPLTISILMGPSRGDCSPLQEASDDMAR